MMTDVWFDLILIPSLNTNRRTELLEMFSVLHSEGRIPGNDNLIVDLTSMVLQTRLSLHLSRISNIILVLHDVRKIFEYISCGEYSVWFLLMNDDGDFEDIDINAHRINFQRMKTIIELRNNSDLNYSRMYWTDADKYVQELFLVSIQLAFGFFSKQHVVYLHSLESVSKHNDFSCIITNCMIWIWMELCQFVYCVVTWGRDVWDCQRIDDETW